MCDYCSCRSMPLIEELTADHDRLSDLGVQVIRAIREGDSAQARASFGELAALLWVHTAVEEAGVFSALRAAGELGDQVDALLADHEATLASIGALAGDQWDEAAALDLIADLDVHIAREEYDLFPATLMAMPPAGWDAAEHAAGQVRQALKASSCVV